ncbi:NUDIX domain-containing protein [Streptomyces sp. NPDC046976]|uniref:NUDIX domain-containing protein n=1 Tax=Streptomyces sp. NPDC046976 TaxID=3155258 RepID=UPI0033C2F227
MTVSLVWAREPIPTSGPSVFLAGPTPRLGGDVESWRLAAVEELAEQWTGAEPLTILTPESRGGKRAAHYDDQVVWETTARQTASAVLFWIPRDLNALPGFTTNVEFGLDIGTGRAVLGCPPDCPNPERNRYLIYVARRHGAPVCETLPDTVAAALALVRDQAARGDSGPEPEPENIRYTADVIAMTPSGEVLLIERGWPPHKGSWALPGGHVDPGEPSRVAAARELKEETGVRVAADELRQVGVWDTPGRDPRGRYVTVAYLAVVPAGTQATAGDDARRAEWWPLDAPPEKLAFDHADILRVAARML